jgi:hypothetical protein
MLHHVAPPGTYQMDIMFDQGVVSDQKRKWGWLLLINVNTRRLFCTQLNHNQASGFDGAPGIKSQESVLNALHILIPIIKHNSGIAKIRCDSERAFISKDVVDYLNEQQIDISQVPQFEGYSNHTSLGIIDRVIRTGTCVKRIKY